MTLLVHQGARLVDATGGSALAGSALVDAVTAVAEPLAALPPGVVFARTAIDLPSVLRYLGALHAQRAVALIDPALDLDRLATLVHRFHPAAVVGIDGVDGGPPDGYRTGETHGPAWLRESAEGVVPHQDLAVLLPTSGSTGNPKLVRLSHAAVLANAEAIADVLGIDGDDVAPTSLPLHYSYGMSVLNSHLVRGATVVVEGSGVLGRGFWTAVHEHKITSLAGVPYHYEMLRRLRFDPARYPSLRTLTQAGGRLRTELIAQFNEAMLAVDGRLFVMYGQTEAAPRMATLPAQRLADKLGSVGPALPGGKFSIRDDAGVETIDAGVTGEVIYRGPNVMMGYAESETELAFGDETGGTLSTGDIGHLDDDGYLYLTGRLKRIGKIFGNRVNLDDVELLARSTGPDIATVAAVPADDKVVLYLEGAPERLCRSVASELAERLHLNATGFDVRSIDAIPLLANGKLDYRTLERDA